ncbi:MAG: glycosyl transferase [Geminicoccaceae bacterium]|nr:glycosyl transferase [Geminicoccaceae bacterium]
MSGPRAFFWVQHLLGTGHLRRALLLAAALADRGSRVLVASGGPPARFPVHPDVEFVQLPPIRTADPDFARLVTAQGEAVDAAHWAERRTMLLAALRAHDPDLLVIEHWPFGRSAFTAEVLALVEAARARGAKVAGSVRDVLVAKADPAKYERMVALAAGLERILVHGDPTLVPFAASFPLAERLGARLEHTGYLAPALAPVPLEARREILVSAGGGAVGERLCRAAIAAARLLSDRPWRIVTGTGLPGAAFAALARDAPAHATVERQREDLALLIAAAAVSVSQAGYNTVVEALAGGTRMVLVPFASASEDEQTRRAEMLAARGLARHLPERELDGERLADAVARALAAPPPPREAVRLDGLARSAELLSELARADRS